ncbi:MAG: hypothetical protein EBQ96_00935 [Proteobacteria bacterium]|nr:hypothetical protein [Pseudomonadota bacterium]
MERLAITALAFASLGYALFGSPTPDNPGIREIVILALLAVCMVAGGLRRESFVQPWSKSLVLLLGYGFSIVLLMGVAGGYAGGDILRDLVGFAALGVPLALYGMPDQRVLMAAMLGIGLSFAARYVISPDLLTSLLAENLLYLANSPLVAFAASWLLLYGCFVERRLWLAIGCVMASLLPILAMAGMMQRATLILLVMGFTVFWISTLLKKPRRALVVALGIAAVFWMYWPDVSGIALSLLDKTRAIGWNARGAEIAALLQAQSQSPLTAIFGAGWGSIFKSPAVGDQWVRFSHSLLTSLWWKAGWLGLTLALVALASLLCNAYRRLRHNLVLFWSLVLPLVPAVFLYGSYKSFCFGLLLLGLARFDWTLGTGNVNQAPSHDHAGSPSVDPTCEPRLSPDARCHGPSPA